MLASTLVYLFPVPFNKGSSSPAFLFSYELFAIAQEKAEEKILNSLPWNFAFITARLSSNRWCTQQGTAVASCWHFAKIISSHKARPATFGAPVDTEPLSILWLAIISLFDSSYIQEQHSSSPHDNMDIDRVIRLIVDKFQHWSRRGTWSICTKKLNKNSNEQNNDTMAKFLHWLMGLDWYLAHFLPS